MAKGHGFLRDWRCGACGQHNPGWRGNCWNAACQQWRNIMPPDLPCFTMDEIAAAMDYADELEAKHGKQAADVDWRALPPELLNPRGLKI